MIVEAALAAAIYAAPAPTVFPAAESKVVSTTQRFNRGKWHRYPSHIRAFGRCVALHESWTAGLWRAQNPVSSASGAFQFIDSTWRTQAHRAGVKNIPSKARYARGQKQARVFAWTIRHGGYLHWRGTSCGYGT